MTKRKTTASAAPPESISFIHQINLSRSDMISQDLATRIQVLQRQLREDVAMKAIAESAAEAMAQHDHLISGGADMVQTRHAQAEVKSQAASSQPETLILEQSPNKPGLFETFSQKSEKK